MTQPLRTLSLLLVAAAGLGSQPVQLRVFSEFQRVDPFGRILDADRALVPREILSPGVARNGYFSFHVAVTMPANESYFLWVQTYPRDAFPWKLYREQFVPRGGVWIPDTLEEARYPYFGAMPDPDANVPGQTTRLYLLDVWVPPDMPVGRVRLEVLAKIGYWRISPMEVRVLAARIPNLPSTFLPQAPPDAEQPADLAAWAPLARYLLRKPAAPQSPPVTVRGIIRRNAMQDMALARTLEENFVEPEIQRLVRDAMMDPARAAPVLHPLPGAEWYLRVRDLIYRAASW